MPPQAEIAPPKNKKRKNLQPIVNNVVGNTLLSLIKVARELDAKGKHSAAEQVHNVIRKYQDRIS